MAVCGYSSFSRPCLDRLFLFRWVARRATCAWREAARLGARLVRPCGVGAIVSGRRAVSRDVSVPGPILLSDLQLFWRLHDIVLVVVEVELFHFSLAVSSVLFAVLVMIQLVVNIFIFIFTVRFHGTRNVLAVEVPPARRVLMFSYFLLSWLSWLLLLLFVVPHTVCLFSEFLVLLYFASV